MKKVLLATIIFGAFFFVNETKAKAGFESNVNIDMRAVFGAAGYYESQYYYFPEIDMFYDIVNRRFVYFENNRWVYAPELPYLYRSYDVARGYKVMINEYKPYLHGNEYREKYREYYDNYNHRSQNANGSGSQGSFQDDRSYRNNNRPDERTMQQDERARAEVNRNTEQNVIINGSNNSYGNVAHPQQNNSGNSQNNVAKDETQHGAANINGSNRSEGIKGDNHNETINNNSTKGQSNGVTKDATVLPQSNSSVVPKNESIVPKNESKDDAQRSQFYSNGQPNGVREAVRSPKFNIGNSQPKSAQDTMHNTQPNIGKDTLRNGQINGTGIQENNGTKSSQRNDHVVMTGHEREYGFGG